MRGGRAGPGCRFVVSATGRRRIGIEREEINWEALREEYLAGGIGQRALAKKHGVPAHALQRRAREEGWAARLRGEETGGEARGALAEAPASAADTRIALRLRKKLLLKLERAADTIPCDATEMKTTAADGAVKLLKLRDLTAAYKELVGDLTEEEREENRVVIDV